MVTIIVRASWWFGRHFINFISCVSWWLVIWYPVQWLQLWCFTWHSTHLTGMLLSVESGDLEIGIFHGTGMIGMSWSESYTNWKRCKLCRTAAPSWRNWTEFVVLRIDNYCTPLYPQMLSTCLVLCHHFNPSQPKPTRHAVATWLREVQWTDEEYPTPWGMSCAVIRS